MQNEKQGCTMCIIMRPRGATAVFHFSFFIHIFFTDISKENKNGNVRMHGSKSTMHFRCSTKYTDGAARQKSFNPSCICLLSLDVIVVLAIRHFDIPVILLRVIIFSGLVHFIFPVFLIRLYF